MSSNRKYILIEAIDESGKKVRKFVPPEKVEEMPFHAVYGDYAMVSMEQEQYAKVDVIQETKDNLLEALIGLIRELAKNEEFWIVKDIGDEKIVGYQIHIPQMDKMGKIVE